MRPQEQNPMTGSTATKRSEKLRTINRLAWIGAFFCVSSTLAWLEWRSDAASAMGWFLATGLWSAICGIGFTLSEWYLCNRGHQADDRE
jgi:hypothetical protein